MHKYLILNLILTASLNVVYSMPKKNEQRKIKIIIADIPGVYNEFYGGLEQKIIKSVAGCTDWDVQFIPIPFGRHTELYERNLLQDKYDAVATVPEGLLSNSFKSISHIDFLNGFSVLKKNKKIKINSFSDLKGLRVVSFVGAKEMYPELKKMVSEMKSYHEISNQIGHNLMLYSERVDVVFSDGLIFALDAKKVKLDNKKYQAVESRFHAISKPFPFNIYFKKEIDMKKFNHCFKQNQDKALLIKKEYLINLIL